MENEGMDFLDELIQEGTRENPSFPAMVDAAHKRRRLFRELRQQREEAGLTQKDVAERMGASQSAVARIEQGDPGTRLSVLDRYALTIGHRVEWRLTGEQADPAQRSSGQSPS